MLLQLTHTVYSKSYLPFHPTHGLCLLLPFHLDTEPRRGEGGGEGEGGEGREGENGYCNLTSHTNMRSLTLFTPYKTA